ncbi:hypothetical protein [Mycolicibacterium peregrinum]|uniref:hypothetical protein n=1 Tax=Mycolicibacterium peregrinum TaxID=43304 RepID=UPI003AAF9DBE
MLVNQNRIMTVSDVRTSMSAVLDQARQGFTTHVSREGRIDAHVVPTNALVHQGSEFGVMMEATVDKWATWLVAEACATGFSQGGDPIGKVFAWLWRSDQYKSMAWLEIYWSAVRQKLDERGCARPAFIVLWRTLEVSLGAGLTHEEIREFEAFTRNYLQHDENPFTLDELAGRDRPRGDNDPWPDTWPGATKGWVKKRWRDLVAGDFVPNPEFAFEIGVDDDHWCRVANLDGTEITLDHADNGDDGKTRGHRTTVHTMADSGSHWVPFRSQPPWHWGC